MFSQKLQLKSSKFSWILEKCGTIFFLIIWRKYARKVFYFCQIKRQFYAPMEELSSLTIWHTEWSIPLIIWNMKKTFHYKLERPDWMPEFDDELSPMVHEQDTLNVEPASISTHTHIELLKPANPVHQAKHTQEQHWWGATCSSTFSYSSVHRYTNKRTTL